MAFVSLLLPTPVEALSYANVYNEQLVGRSDVVVAASVVSCADNACKLSVSESLLGSAPQEIHVEMRLKLESGKHGIFFLENRGQGFALLKNLPPTTPGFVPLAEMEEIKRLAAMKARPAQFVNDPQLAYSPAFLEMLGWTFRDKEQIDGMTKQAAIDHLNRSLSLVDRAAIATVLTALKSLGSKDSTAILPLIAQPDADVRETALMFLEWAADLKAVNPICEALDRVNPKDSASCASRMVAALLAIGDVKAVPALERAVKRGVVAPANALGGLGNEASFEILQNALARENSSEAISITCALANLVRRSNKPLEKWMDEHGWNRIEGVRHKNDWATWWDKNKADFRIVPHQK